MMLRRYQVAVTSATVLITGESGSGKELVARAIHGQSPRKDHQFVAVNCSAMPESLLESELFGHLKGSFTGAIKDRKGLLEEADQGTLFLDEVGDLTPHAQVKLLRVIQEGEIKRVGDNKMIRVDVRIIAATHQSLAQKIKEGTFREDLYYRLNVIHIGLPALRQRRADIPLLAYFFLEKYAKMNGKEVTDFSPGALAALKAYDWPGNIRQLENVVERTVILCRHRTIDTMDLFPAADREAGEPETIETTLGLPYKAARERYLEDFNRRYLCHALARQGGNVSRAAQEAGVPRQYFHRLMRGYGIAAVGFKPPARQK